MLSSAPLPAIEASPWLGLWVGEGRGSVLPTAGQVRSLTLQVQDPFPIAEDLCVRGWAHTHTPLPLALHGQSPPGGQVNPGARRVGLLFASLPRGWAEARAGVLESRAAQLVQDSGPCSLQFAALHLLQLA